MSRKSLLRDATRKKTSSQEPLELFKPYFVTSSKDSFSLFKWKKFKLQDGSWVEAPAHWSEWAVEIAASKYLRKKDVPKSKAENSVKQMILRVTECLRKEAVKQKYLSEKQSKMFSEELKFILVSQRAFFNSPVWFNCGLWDSYQIQGDDAHWVYKKSPVLERGVYKHPQVSACFIQSVQDSIESIYELLKTEAKLFKLGSGSGTNFSPLRSRFELLSGGGTSSGLLSFLEVFDKSAGIIKSGGTTRRAAKMVCLDVDHPEILDFIQWKVKEEKKAQALIEKNYSAGLDGEALKSVSGQNSNNSVRLTDRFLKAVEKNQNYKLRFPSDPQKKISLAAKQVWKELVKAAWQCADPGVQFHDTIQKWHTCKASGPINASNPCSEFMFLDDSACNLASINLLHFLKFKEGFLVEDFTQTVKVMLLAQELLVDLGGYPSQKICENSHNYRPLGLGFCGLGAALIQLGVPYDSKEARSIAAEVACLLQASSFYFSTLMASCKGAFKEFSKNRNSVLKVFKMHYASMKKLNAPLGSLEISDSYFKRAFLNFSKHGVRNSQLTVMAPTGTIGLAMDCETTGIEPEFSLVKFKSLVGGGVITFESQSLRKSLKNLGYDESQVQEIIAHLRVHQSLDEAPGLSPQHLPIFDCALRNGHSPRCIQPEAHVQMMAAIQPFVSGAISKTVNLPGDVTEEELSDLFFKAWKLGLKSLAVYREGSKVVQPLQRAQVNASLDPLSQVKCTDCGV